MLGGFFSYDAPARDVVRWDIAATLVMMAITEFGALSYYRRTV